MTCAGSCQRWTFVVPGLVLVGAVLLLGRGEPLREVAAAPDSLAPGLSLPRVGTIGDLPPEADRVVVVLDGDGRLRVKGADLTLGGLTSLLERMRKAPEREEADGTSKWNVVVAVDATVPWGAVAWVLQAAADPRAKVYRTFFLVLPEHGQGEEQDEEGALAAFLRKDGGRGGDGNPYPPPRVHVDVRMGGTGTSDPAALAAALRARAGGLSGARVQLSADAHTPFGFVLRVVDAVFRSGAAGVDFRGIPLPKEADPLGKLVQTAAADSRQPSLRLDGGDLGRGTVPSLAPVERVHGRFAGDTADPADDVVMEESEEIHAWPVDPPTKPDDATRPEDPARPLAPYAYVFDRRKRENDRPEDAPARDAVERALTWLAAHQSPDGRFEAAGWNGWCQGKPVAADSRSSDGLGQAAYDTGTTGLALLAFLGAGYTNRGDHVFAKTVARGLRALKNVQDPEGCFGPRTAQHYVYNHAMAALAMVEAYAMTESPIFKGSAQKGLDFIALARNPYFAWRYGVKPGDNDTSVTGWMTSVLLTARAVNRHVEGRGKTAPLVIDEEAFEGVGAWIEKVTDSQTGRVGYMSRGSGPARPQELVDRFPTGKSESMTAVAVYLRHLLRPLPLGLRNQDPMQKGLALLGALPPVWNETDGSIDLTYWFYGSLAAFHAGENSWGPWSKALQEALLPHQRTDGDPCAYAGSWDPVDPWGPDGGRLYATALAALALETPWRALPAPPR